VKANKNKGYGFVFCSYAADRGGFFVLFTLKDNEKEPGA
jgi:hypothetical protein